MGALRTKMIEEMKLRNFSPRTHQSYLSAVVGLVKYYRRSPDQLTQDEIRSYLLHLEQRGLSASSRNVAISGFKFFYQQILGWNEEQLFLPPRKRTWRLPEVLKTLTLEAHEFIRRFLLHILPDGFMRIRHFGFLANRSKKQSLSQCRKLLKLDPALPESPNQSVKDVLREPTGVDLSRCPCCQKGTMIVVGDLPRIASSPLCNSS